MTVALENTSSTPSASSVANDRVAATEDLVAALLRAAIEVSEQSFVRKTTLAALMDAAEETGEDLGDLVDVIARANLTDALLGLRERGLIVLTDDGFTLTAGSQSPPRWDEFNTWLKGLVGKKMDEWHMRSTHA